MPPPRTLLLRRLPSSEFHFFFLRSRTGCWRSSASSCSSRSSGDIAALHFMSVAGGLLSCLSRVLPFPMASRGDITPLRVHACSKIEHTASYSAGETAGVVAFHSSSSIRAEVRVSGVSHLKARCWSLPPCTSFGPPLSGEVAGVVGDHSSPASGSTTRLMS